MPTSETQDEECEGQEQTRRGGKEINGGAGMKIHTAKTDKVGFEICRARRYSADFFGCLTVFGLLEINWLE